MADSLLFPMDGGCACGLVRYRVHARPLIVHCCHCTSCQRETGSAFAVNAIVESSLVTLLPSASPTVPASPHCELKAAGPTSPPMLSTSEAVQSTNPVEPTSILTPSESGRGQDIARCPTCHVAVWSYYSPADRLVRFIRAGTMDQAWLISPDVHIYVRSKREFVKIEDGKPQFEGFYRLAEVWSQESLQRWEKLNA